MTIFSHDWMHLVFIGCLLIMGIYNFFFYFIVKDRTYLYYTTYLFFNAIYVPFVWFRADPALRDLVPHFLDSWFDYFALATTFAMIAYLSFIQSFLQLSTLLPKWDRVFTFSVRLGIPVAIAALLLLSLPQIDNKWATLVMFLYVVLNLLMGLIFIIPVAKTKDPKAYFFLAGMTPLILGAGYAAIFRFSDTVNFLQLYQIGLLMEVIFFSLGLAYKQQQQEKEQQKTKFKLMKSQLEKEQKQAETIRLKELDQVKSRLYTNITHEFRTPLTVIMGMTNNIQHHEPEKKLIQRNANSLLHLVNKMLDLTKLEKGTMQLQEQMGDIIAFLKYLTESFNSLTEAKEIKLFFYKEVNQLNMSYDEEKIRQIIYNLMENAIKFTPTGGSVLLHVNKVSIEEIPFLQIKVKDSGLGIAAEHLPHIFDRFYQIDHSNTRKTGGTGIGLSLVKELITLMGGQIDVVSKPNKGTTFSILLPIKVEVATMPEVSEMPKLIHPSSSTTKQKLAETSEVITTNDHPVLLIIEDNRDVHTYIQSIVAKDYQVLNAHNGKQGIELAFDQVPDIIISDVMMPEKDGFEVCQTLKGDNRTSHIPIILLTAKAEEASRIKGLEAGADAFLVKPFNKKELLVRLEKLRELRNQLQKQLDVFPKKNSHPAPKKEKEFLQKIIELIEQNLDNTEFGIAELCKKAHLSHSQLYRKIKALTGLNINAFIKKIRLQKAQILLRQTQLPIADIAYQTGFKDPNYFSRVFSEHFGISPSSARDLPKN